MRRSLIFLSGLLCGLILAIATQSRSVDFEAAIGKSEYCCMVDGVWWQSPYGFTGTVRPWSLEIGARQRFGNAGIHLAFVDLGTAKGQNIATMRDEDFGRFDPSRPCDVPTRANCLGTFTARQHVRGVSAGASYGREIVGGVRLEGEAGMFFYRADWRITIYCENRCGAGTGPAFDPPETYSFTSNIRRTPYISARTIYRGAFLMWRRFENIDGGGNGEDGQFAIGLTSGPVNQVMAGMIWSWR